MGKQRLGNQLTKALCALTILVLVICGGYYLLIRDHPIWRVQGIGFGTKLRLTLDPDTASMTGWYILRPDADTQFLILTYGPEGLFDKYGHAVYDHTRWVTNCIFPLERQYRKRRITITTLANTPRLHCWLVESVPGDEMLLWRSPAHAKYHPISCQGISPSDLPENAAILGPIDTLYTSGEWRWFVLFSDFSLKANKAKYRPLVTRYAQGRFTNRERVLNAKSNLTAAQVQRFARKMQAKYRL